MDLHISASSPLRGEFSVPGDKSISHRALLLGALADGSTRVTGFLPGEDCLSTLRCLDALGVRHEQPGTAEVIMHGVGLKGLAEPENVLDAGNSGTTARLLLGILAGQPFTSFISGDASLRRRPMARVVKPLSEMGAVFQGRQGGKLLPLSVTGKTLKGITYYQEVASAQVKSALLLAGLFADEPTTVVEPAQSRDHSERMLAAFGAGVQTRGLRVTVAPAARLEAQNVVVPGDISSSAFFAVAASLVPGSELVIKNAGVNPTRTGVIDVLKRMGARIDIENQRLAGGEPVADLVVRHAPLKGTSVGGTEIPRLIDEIPVLAVAAAAAAGTTEIRDAAELRVKESDRLQAIACQLTRMGVQVEELPDGLVIVGGHLHGAVCESLGDHRMAMSLAVAGLVAHGETVVRDFACVEISFPGFLPLLKELQQ